MLSSRHIALREAAYASAALAAYWCLTFGQNSKNKTMFCKLLTQIAVLLPFFCSALAATSLGSLTDSAGQSLVQASSCTLTPCLQGVAYGAGYLAGCQASLSRHSLAAQNVWKNFVRHVCPLVLCASVSVLDLQRLKGLTRCSLQLCSCLLTNSVASFFSKSDLI